VGVQALGVVRVRSMQMIMSWDHPFVDAAAALGGIAHSLLSLR
jgi:hypothetical protein